MSLRRSHQSCSVLGMDTNITGIFIVLIALVTASTAISSGNGRTALLITGIGALGVGFILLIEALT